MPRDTAMSHGASGPSTSGVLAPQALALQTPGGTGTYEDSTTGTCAMITYFGFWTCGWVLLFYCLTATEPYWAGCFPKSTKVHENDRYWSSRNLLGVIHALFISVITVPAIFVLWPATDEVRFGTTGHMATCRIGPDRAELAAQWSWICEAVALAGMGFTAFTLADVAISALHGLATADYVAHHIAFITAGLIIRGHCMMPFNASILLAMEASTPFLNFLLFFRHRGAAYKRMVQVNGIVFVLLFVFFRLCLNTYGAITLWYHRQLIPLDVPKWQAWFLLVAVAAGAGVQFFWFPQIAKTFGSGLLELLGRSRASVSDAGMSQPLLQSGAGARCSIPASEGVNSPLQGSANPENSHERSVLT